MMATELWHGFEMRRFTFEDREAIIVFPKETRAGAPWALKTEYWNAFPDIEVQLLTQGYHVAYVKNHNRWFTREECDAKARFVRFVSENYQLSSKCIPIGMSCGGGYAVKFGGMHPELIQCMYIDAPALNFCSIPGKIGVPLCETIWSEEFIYAYPGIQRYQLPGFGEHPLCFAEALLKHRIPIVQVYGKEDQTVIYEENGKLLEELYKGSGLMYTIGVNARGHHPHGMIGDNSVIIDFILKHS